MSAPRLDHKMTLEAPLKSDDGAGGAVVTWVALGTIWARLEPGRGTLGLQDDAAVSTVPYRVIVRAAPFGSPARPNPGQRLRDDNRILWIRAVTEYGHDRAYLTLFAEEELAP